MSVWYCLPSKRPNGGTLPLWKERGYKIAALACEQHECMDIYEHQDRYIGWAASVNRMVKAALAADPECEWVVTGGDDIHPDMAHSPEQIAEECRLHFGGTLGVMQPTGDRWGADEKWAQQRYPGRPAYIDRICGSPWMGREFCERIYGGNGPLWAEFFHMYGDEHLQNVAEKLGILWQRRDLIHLHEHWGRKKGATHEDIPDFMRPYNSPEHWRESKALFDRLAAGGFAEAVL